MKLKQESVDILSGGLLDETDFSMDDSSLHIVFDILRSKVYKDPISSICREVASNSRDAQREINKDCEIEIEISDRRDSMWVEDGLNIIFRDFGVGLSPARIKEVYSKYGASTKRDSNIQTGGFGLGAKTPFSYADSFTVRTVVNNIEYHYSIYIDESRKGKIALIDESEFVSDTNITEIIIPLKSDSDLIAFKKAVIRNTFFRETRPKLINFGNNFSYELYTLKSFASSKNDYDVVQLNDIVHSNINVVIDGIYYPVDVNIMSQYKNDYKVGFILYFNNGELSISANRETLQYDDFTKNEIIRRMEDILPILSKNIVSEIEGQNSLYEASFLLWKKRSESNLDMLLTKTLNFSFKGVPIAKSKESIILKTYNFYLYTRYGSNNIVRKKLDNFFSDEVFNNFNYIFQADGTPFKSDPQRSNTLTKETNQWIIVSDINLEIYTKKNYDVYEDRRNNELNLFSKYGLTMKPYNNIVRTPNEKKPKVSRVKKPLESFYKCQFRVKNGYQGYHTNEFRIDKQTNVITYPLRDQNTGNWVDYPVKMVYYVDYKENTIYKKESKIQEDIIKDNYDLLASDLDNIVNNKILKPYKIFFVRVPESKVKFLKNAITIADYMNDPDTLKLLEEIIIRLKIGNTNDKFKLFSELNLESTILTNLNRYVDICKKIPYRNYSGLSYVISKLTLKIQDPNYIFKQISEKYPLINTFNDWNDEDINAQEKYIELINEHNALKEELEKLKNKV